MTKKYIISVFAAILAMASASAITPQKDSLTTLPWQQSVRKDLLTSGVQSVGESDLEHISISDIRRRLRGQFLSAQVLENCGGLNQSGVLESPFMNSDQVSIQSRCFWNILCVIDDMPVPMNQYLLDPNQIESITLVTDIADKVSYGPLASKGMFYITTKKGGYNTPLKLTFDIESGIESPATWPEYVNGEQYAILSNIAREQSGYLPLYSASDIQWYANGNPYDMKYPNVDYRELFFKSYKPVSRFGFNANAGSNNIKYNVSVNGLYGDDLVKIGPHTYFAKLNLSSGVTAKIGQYIEANMTFNGMATFTQDGNGGSFYEANITPPVAYPLTLNIDPDSEYYDPSLESGMTVYGTTKVETDSPYAAQVAGGYSRAKRRSGTFSSTVNVDMSWLLPGLKSKTYVGLATFFTSTMGKNEDYLAYYWDKDRGIDGRSITHLGTKEASETLMSSKTYESLNAYERLSYDWSKGRHMISSSLTGWMTKAATSANDVDIRLVSSIGTLKYSFADKYVIDLAANYSGVPLFRKDKRWGLFPAVGIAWNVEKENFMQGAAWLTKLKLRAQYGKDGDLEDLYTADNYMWEAQYHFNKSNFYHFGPRTGTCWFGNLTEYLQTTGLDKYGNEELTWPVITEFDAGFDATLFDKLDVKFNWYHDVQSGVIMNISEEISTTLGHVGGGGPTKQVTSQSANHDQYTYKGWELGLCWHQDWNDFGYEIGVEGRHWDKINDIVTNNFYNYDYQNAAGRHASEWRGYVYEGIFQSQEEIDNSPLLSSETKVGDLKYKDINGDGKIDANDKMFIASGNAKLRYSVNLGLRYKKFDFNMIGTGQAFFKAYLSSTYFMGGYSTSNYSMFIWDNLIKDANGNPTAYGVNFPRLTYIYNSVNNECSEYWLRDGGWFKIQSAEIGYTTEFKKAKRLKGARFSLRAANLLTFTNLEYIDPEASVSGIQAAPLYRSLTLGAKFNF